MRGFADLIYMLDNGWAIAELCVSLASLAAAIAGVIYLARLHRRGGLDWSERKIAVVGMSGAMLAVVLLCLPELVSWLAYLGCYDMVDRGLLGVGHHPDHEAALIARGLADGFGVSWLAGAGKALLLVPCALLAGLSLTLRGKRGGVP